MSGDLLALYGTRRRLCEVGDDLRAFRGDLDQVSQVRHQPCAGSAA